MRSSPTFSHLGWGFLAAAILVGCAAKAAQDPVDEPLAQDPDATQESGDDDDSPTFEPEFKDGGASQKKDASSNGQTTSCDDPDDPGSAENVAADLPNTSDCDNSYKTVSGVANGPVDIDWYKLSATDEGISVSHPGGCSRDTDFSTDSANTELCVYATCQDSTADAVKGCSKGNPVTSSLGLKGCCVEGPGQAIPDLSCKGGLTKDDSATFLIRVKQVNTSQCLPYQFRYRF